LDWIGLDWIGLDWIGLDWIGSYIPFPYPHNLIKLPVFSLHSLCSRRQTISQSYTKTQYPGQVFFNKYKQEIEIAAMVLLLYYINNLTGYYESK